MVPEKEDREREERERERNLPSSAESDQVPPHIREALVPVDHLGERESSLLTTYWSEST